MIEVKNIKKSFEDKTVLDDVNAVMQSGKTNLIIGTSGSGKTVLMKIMIGLMSPDKGSVLYEGQDLTQMDDKQQKVIRMQIGMLFQGGALFDSKTVQDNVMFPL